MAESWRTAMPFIPIPSTVLLTVQFQDDDGVVAINRHYLNASTPPVEDDLTEICTTYVTYWVENFQTATPDNWNLTGLIARAMNEEDGLEFVQTADLPVPGSAGTAFTPNQVSYTCTWLTGFAGRSKRGRTYGVGLDPSFIATGQKRITDGAQAELQGLWDGLRAAFETDGHAMQVVSLQSGGIPLTEGVATPVLAGRVNFPLATQRRRLR